MSTGEVPFPYRHFTQDEDAYEKSREFWSQAFTESLGPSLADRWSDWIEDIFRDGNPIFSKVSTSLGRGVLVQQTEGGDDRYWFKCWVSHAEQDDRVVPYLFVETFVSVEAKTYFKKLIEAWCAEEFGEEDMERLTDLTRLEAGERFGDIDFTLDA